MHTWCVQFFYVEEFIVTSVTGARINLRIVVIFLDLHYLHYQINSAWDSLCENSQVVVIRSKKKN
jgi:hypothetical protein